MKKIFLGITIALSLFTIVQAQTSPEQFLGFPIGSDQKLVSWQQVTDYFHQLEQHSDRVLVEKLGKTTQDKDFILVMISSPENLLHLERYKKIQQILVKLIW